MYMPGNSLKGQTSWILLYINKLFLFYKSLLLIEENQVLIFVDFMNNKDYITVIKYIFVYK